jgi:hypothetical protein
MPVRTPKLAGWLLISLLAALVIAVARPALAQQNADKPTAEQQQAAASKEALKVEQYQEAQHVLNGPAGNPECVWLGRQVISLLSNDDIDAAFRHLDLYDRFGCPAAHIQAALRCVLLHPLPTTSDPKPTDQDLMTKQAHTCWVNPALPVAAPPAPAVPAPAPAAAH